MSLESVCERKKIRKQKVELNYSAITLFRGEFVYKRMSGAETETISRAPAFAKN